MDVFAADVGAKDNAGRTAMATLLLRHKSMRPGVGPHAAKKLELIESFSSTMQALEEGSGEDDDSGLDDTTPRRGGASSRLGDAAHALSPGMLSSRSRSSAATGGEQHNMFALFEAMFVSFHYSVGMAVYNCDVIV